MRGDPGPTPTRDEFFALIDGLNPWCGRNLPAVCKDLWAFRSDQVRKHLDTKAWSGAVLLFGGAPTKQEYRQSTNNFDWALNTILAHVASEGLKDVPPLPEQDIPSDPTLFRLGNWDLTEPGYATYKDIRFPLEHINRRLLACLIRAKGRAVHAHHLIDAAVSTADPGDLPVYITRLRQHLRKYLFKFINESDPIPHCDPRGYRLDLM